MAERQILVIDEGTTSTRAMLFDPSGRVGAVAQRDLTQFYPEPGWVEQDAAEIWELTRACCHDVIAKAGGAEAVRAIGITNQRETLVAWDRETGAPLCRAIVWQDRRTADVCAKLKEAGHEAAVRAKTGLLLDPYFSATMMTWMLQHEPAVRAAGKRLAFGTIDSYLAFRLSGGDHITDATNASRTMLMDLRTGQWDAGLAELFGVPTGALPRIVDSAGALGSTDAALFGAPIAITGIAGDQQAATVGQGCTRPGQTKATYGTGAFVLTHAGTEPPRSEHRLLSTVLHQIASNRTYALEGSIFVAGSLMQWLRDSIGLIESTSESEEMARSVPDSAGVTVVPGLSGLGAPHWDPDATGVIAGLTFSATRAHIVRAALESIALQSHDLQRAFASDGHGWEELRVDGGMAANAFVVQDIADILAIPVVRPASVETTALGAAMLAAVGAGVYDSLDAAGAMIPSTTRFEPAGAPRDRQERLDRWSVVLGAALHR